MNQDNVYTAGRQIMELCLHMIKQQGLPAEDVIYALATGAAVVAIEGDATERAAFWAGVESVLAAQREKAL